MVTSAEMSAKRNKKLIKWDEKHDEGYDDWIQGINEESKREIWKRE